MRLSRDRQQAAHAFILAHARPLERALYAHFFEGAEPNAAWDALAAYQNPDGGFGHAIEPDLRTPASSALATTVAFQTLRATHAPDSHPLVERAIAYLLTTYDAPASVWQGISPQTNDAPHAPWWTWSENVAENWDGFRANPRAEILAYLYDHPTLVPPDLLVPLTNAVIDHAEARPDPIEMHDLLCYVTLAETPALPMDAQRRLRERIARALPAVVLAPSGWGGYGLMPLSVATSPASPFATQISDLVERNIDYEIGQQGENGAWSPAWSWADDYPEAWAAARVEWQGVITLKMLRAFQAWDRLEP